MDPITAAIVAALANLSKDVIKDSYTALKSVLKKKFGNESDLVDAIENLEKRPDSKGRKATVEEEVERAKVNDDPEIKSLVQELLNKIQRDSGSQEILNQNQSNTVSGIGSIGGDLNFAPVQAGGDI